MSNELSEEQKRQWERKKKELQNQGIPITKEPDQNVKVTIAPDERLLENARIGKTLKEKLAEGYAEETGKFINPDKITTLEEFDEKVRELQYIRKSKEKTPSGSIPLTSRQTGDEIDNSGKDLLQHEFETPEDAIKFLEHVESEGDSPQERMEAKAILEKMKGDSLKQQSVEGREWVYEGQIAGEANRKRTKNQWKRKK